VTALLTDTEILSMAKSKLSIRSDVHPSDSHFFVKGFVNGGQYSRDFYEARLAEEREQRDAVIEENARNAYAAIAAAKAEDAKVRAGLVEALERFLAAADDSCDASPDHDDIAAMLEYGDADKALRAALDAAKEVK
jgi:hypothetical protein